MARGDPTVADLAKAYGAALRRRAEAGGPSQRDLAVGLETDHPRINENMQRYDGGDPPKSVVLLFKACLAVGLAPVFAPASVVAESGLEHIDPNPKKAAAAFVEAIGAARLAASMTQTDVAAACGTDPSLISEMNSRYRKGNLPKATVFLFGAAELSGLLPVMVAAQDFFSVERTFASMSKAEIKAAEKAAARDEKEAIAVHLEELIRLRDEDSDFWRHLSNAKLTVEDVAYIRGSRASLDDVADRFGISKSTASYIRNERTWKPISLASPR